MSYFPNVLTVLRIVIIPVLVWSFYIQGFVANFVAASLFLLASITDFFDGYFARSLKAQSNFGKCLDPIADKLLVVVAISMLIHFGNRNPMITIPGVIIIAREILVSGLREFLASIRVSVPVSKLAKYKTFVQMSAITLLLLGDVGSNYVVSEIFGQENDRDLKLIVSYLVTISGEILFMIAAFLTVVTGYLYLKIGLKNM